MVWRKREVVHPPSGATMAVFQGTADPVHLAISIWGYGNHAVKLTGTAGARKPICWAPAVRTTHVVCSKDDIKAPKLRRQLDTGLTHG